jgi:hypothetical protein
VKANVGLRHNADLIRQSPEELGALTSLCLSTKEGQGHQHLLFFLLAWLFTFRTTEEQPVSIELLSQKSDLHLLTRLAETVAEINDR